MESKIQNKIKKRLESNGWLVLKIIQLNEAGFPDIIAMKSGKAIFIEVKDTGKEPGMLQLHRIQLLRNNGFTAFWTDDPNDEKIDNLIQWKL